MLKPNRYFKRISDIDIQRDLLDEGIRVVFADIDNTIRPRDTRQVPRDVADWLARASQAGVRVCLLSNNVHADTYDFAYSLGLPVVAKALKPLPFGVMRALRTMDARVCEAVMVGDQVLTDIAAARVCGMAAYLVEPLCDLDLPYMEAMRHVERAMIAPMVPETRASREAEGVACASAEDECMPAEGSCGIPEAVEDEHLYLLGHPIAHSKSPVMYNALYPQLGLAWSYDFADFASESEARAFLDGRGFLSVNITTPYKPLALSCADDADLPAQLAGGANVLVNAGGLLHAYNVDGEGCATFLELAGVTFDGARVVVCGTGPTSLSIFHACLQRGAHVVLVGRDGERARAKVESYLQQRNEAEQGEPVGRAIGLGYDEASFAISGAHVVVNATPLGMNEGDPAPFDTHLLSEYQVAFDCVYGHGLTAFRKGAQEQGCRTFDGAGMLVAQAVCTARIVMAAHAPSVALDESSAFRTMAQAAGFDVAL